MLIVRKPGNGGTLNRGQWNRYVDTILRGPRPHFSRVAITPSSGPRYRVSRESFQIYAYFPGRVLTESNETYREP